MSLDVDQHSPGRILISILKELKLLTLSNIEYYQNASQSVQAQFHTAFCLLYEYLEVGVEPALESLLPSLRLYDFSPGIPGNGYRSLVKVVHKACAHLLQLARHITVNRDGVLFRRRHYCQELEAYVAMLGQLRACLYYAQKLMAFGEDGQLFMDEEQGAKGEMAAHLMSEFESLSQDCFYGRCLGFQFCESMHTPLNVVAIAMASFSEGYQEKSHAMQVASSLLNSHKFFLNPELRGQQVASVTRTADIKFCKAFWSITESDLMRQLPAILNPNLQVNEVFNLGPDAFEMMSEDGTESIIITPPCAHTGPGPVRVRLLSYNLLSGQEAHCKSAKLGGGSSQTRVAAPVSGLLIHCHGGGFVAQSSRSHEVYLKTWAKELNVPILSIDYSLAPEFPFPRALEECFYAYAWAVKNCLSLGSTGERICVVGDSAGANLIIATAMRAANVGIRRPDGLLAVYPTVLVRYSPSPSRLLTLMDPLLPMGILSRCLSAYAGASGRVDPCGSPGMTDLRDNKDHPSLQLQEDSDSEEEWLVVSSMDRGGGGTRVKQVSSHNDSFTDSSPPSEDSRSSSPQGVSGVPGSFPAKTNAAVGEKNARGRDDVKPAEIFQQGQTEVKRADGKMSENAGRSSNRGAQSGMMIGDLNTEVKHVDDDDKTVRKFYANANDSSPTMQQFSNGPPSYSSACRGQEGSTEVESQRGGPDEQVPEGQRNVHPGDAVHNANSEQRTHLKQQAGSSQRQPGVGESSSPVNVPMDTSPVISPMTQGTAKNLTDVNANDRERTSENDTMTSSWTEAKDPMASTPSSIGPSSLCSGNSPGSDGFRSPLTPGSVPTSATNHSDRHLSGMGRNHSSDSESYHTPASEMIPNHSFESIDLQSEEPPSFEILSMSEESNNQEDTVGPLGPVGPLHPPMALRLSLQVESPHSSGHLLQQMQGSSGGSVESPGSSRPYRPRSLEESRRPSLGPGGTGRILNSPEEMSHSLNSSPVARGHGIRTGLRLDLRTSASDYSLEQRGVGHDPRLQGAGGPDAPPNIPLHTLTSQDFIRDRHMLQSPLHTMRGLPIVRNPYMSPLLAPDHLLEGLPRVFLVACHLDPLLDDAVMFAKRLRSMGKAVDLRILDELPHGFLNFSMVSKEARAASDLCLGRLKVILTPSSPATPSPHTHTPSPSRPV